MITLSRSLAKQVFTVFRQSLEITPRQYSGQLVEVVTGPAGLIIRAQQGRFAVEYREEQSLPPVRFVVPFDLLQRVAGRQGEACLSRIRDDQILATWNEGPIPQEYKVPAMALAEDQLLCAVPTLWATNDPQLLLALAEAMRMTDRESARYALSCLKLGGKEGTITATDGRQLLQQTGFALGFDEEVLVQPTPILGSRALPHDRPVEVGKTEEHLALRVGMWTCWLPLEKNARYPRVEDVIPRIDVCRSHLTLDPGDRDFLACCLPQLPVNDAQHEPLTLDLNGKVLVRSISNDKVLEVKLTNSQKSGENLRLATNRKFLASALRLGFSSFHFTDSTAPVLAIDERRCYVWAVLDRESQLAAAGEATVITSPPATAMQSTRRRCSRALCRNC